jgi:hypothetical protein
MQAYEGWKDEERSPIFHQFLDCVYQCLHQMPHAFEFNEELLLFILEHVQSGWFGDFMFNCERERRDFKATHGCLSMWAVVLHNMDRFRNDYNYVPQVGAIMPVARLGRLVLWEKWFNRWHDRLWRAAWIQQCHVEDFDDEDGAALNGGANAGSSSTGPGRAWDDDSAVTACKRCSKSFSFINRRHHCRRCGHIFCEKCAGENRTIVSISAYRPVRVCSDCAHIIDQGIENESIIVQYEAMMRDKRNNTASGLTASDGGQDQQPSFGVTFDSRVNVGERSTTMGLVDDWNGEY